MRIFRSVFGISITIFFFLHPMAYSWIFYLSATIHKNYMFLLCNGLLVFICLNSRSICGFSPGKYYGEEQTVKSGDGQPQFAGSCESKPPDGSRRVDEVEGESETEGEDGSLYAVEVRENGSVEDKEVDKTLCVIVNDKLKVSADDETLSVVEEICNDESEVTQEQEQGGTDTISLEELNKKCEEFIRRMKAEIRSDSQIILCY